MSSLQVGQLNLRRLVEAFDVISRLDRCKSIDIWMIQDPPLSLTRLQGYGGWDILHPLCTLGYEQV